ncbi:MAG: mechanosensitive ion channel [Akkermansia sp.]
MYRHLILTLFFFMASFALIPHAIGVEKEASVDMTLSELATELNESFKNMPHQMSIFDRMRNDYTSRNIKINNQLNEMAVVLYSQSQSNMFSLAFYCQKIAELKEMCDSKEFPFTSVQAYINKEISRLASLKQAITNIEPSQLNESGRIARDNAIQKCIQLNDSTQAFKQQVDSDKVLFGSLRENLDSLDSKAKKQMSLMMNNVFLVPALSFNSFTDAWQAFSSSFQTTYFPTKGNASRLKELESFGINILFYILGAYLASRLLFHVILKKRLIKRKSLDKTSSYTLAGTLLFTALCFSISQKFQSLDFMNSVTTIGTEFLITMAAMILLLTIRFPHETIGKAIRFYLPSMILCTIFIIMRMSMAPNMIINLALPIIFPLITIFQFISLYRNGKYLHRIDRAFGITSLVICLGGIICSLLGYSFMAFLFNLVWIILMTGILVLLSIWQLLNSYQKKRYAASNEANKWFRPFLEKLLLPILSIGLIIFSTLWPASIFDISHIIISWSGTTIPDIGNIATRLSINSILIIIFIGIVLRYLVFVIKNMLHDIYQDSYETGVVATYVTLGSLILWALFIIGSFFFLGINFNGILVVMGGMSMGIGFALKDTIDNLICGLSLIFGRLRQGDVVECDGIRGKVSSIGYRTTFIETLDGSIIAFQNNQLFNKNFRNLTKNHLYESVKVEIGISYGTDIDLARELILTALKEVDTLARTKHTTVVLDSFGDNSVNLGVWVWVPVRNKPATLSKVREKIYQTFNEHDINIPFPQQDIYIKSMPANNNVTLP